jgi:hypothetical protein
VTSESLGTALVVRAALLVGVAIPVLVQLRTTLRTMEKTYRRSGAQPDEALGATTAAAPRLDTIREVADAGVLRVPVMPVMTTFCSATRGGG